MAEQAGQGQEQRQDETIAFLLRRDSYPGAVSEIERIDTHGAIVFLAGQHAYKLKRAITLPYLDFSTVEKRRHVCERELRLNRRTAPALYQGLLPIRRGADGVLHFGGEGEVADWVVVMKRFPQHALFDRLSAAGRLDPALMGPLADTIHRFHHDAEPVKDAPWLPAIQRIVETLDETLLGAPAASLGLPASSYLAALRRELQRREPLLRARQAAGYVRRCHGDLHLKNIVLEGGEPVLFDALEFDDALTCIDVIYDLAFLLMDLCHRGRHGEANAVLNRYIEHDMPPGALDGLALLPLFLSLRAGIRAMVGVHGLAFIAEHARLEAERAIRDYGLLALDVLGARRPMLVCVGGLSGTGKTTAARSLAPDIGGLPGAIHIRTDVERKRMLGVEPTARLDASAYTEAAGEEVYRHVAEKASRILHAGHSVVIDAVFSGAVARALAEATARDTGAAFAGLWLEASTGTMIERVEQRSNDASDATRDVVLMQARASVPPPPGWTRVDAGGGIADTLTCARKALGLSR
jgi:uncharacterized protein